MATNLTPEQLAAFQNLSPAELQAIAAGSSQVGEGLRPMLGTRWGSNQEEVSGAPGTQYIAGFSGPIGSDDMYNAYSPTGEFLGRYQTEDDSTRALLPIAMALGGHFLFGGGGLGGAGAGSSALGHGAWLGEGVASGVFPWDAAMVDAMAGTAGAGAGAAAGTLGPAELAIAAGEGMLPITAAEAATAGLTSSQLAALGSGIGLSGSSGLLSSLPSFLQNPQNISSLLRAGLSLSMLGGAGTPSSPPPAPTGPTGVPGGGGGSSGGSPMPIDVSTLTGGLSGSSGRTAPNDANYYNAVQQYYNQYMPNAPEDVAGKLSSWYSGDYSAYAPQTAPVTGGGGAPAAGGGTAPAPAPATTAPAAGGGTAPAANPPGFNQDVYDYVAANLDNPDLIFERLRQVGGNTAQLAEALGIPESQVLEYFGNAGINLGALDVPMAQSPLTPEQAAQYYNATVGRGLMSEANLVEELRGIGVDLDTLNQARGLLTSGGAPSSVYNQSYNPQEIQQAIVTSLQANPNIRKEDLKIQAATQYGVDPFEFERQWAQVTGNNFVDKYGSSEDPIISFLVNEARNRQNMLNTASSYDEFAGMQEQRVRDMLGRPAPQDIAAAYMQAVGSGQMSEADFVREALSRGVTQEDLLAAQSLLSSQG